MQSIRIKPTDNLAALARIVEQQTPRSYTGPVAVVIEGRHVLSRTIAINRKHPGQLFISGDDGSLIENRTDGPVFRILNTPGQPQAANTTVSRIKAVGGARFLEMESRRANGGNGFVSLDVDTVAWKGSGQMPRHESGAYIDNVAEANFNRFYVEGAGSQDDQFDHGTVYASNDCGAVSLVKSVAYHCRDFCNLRNQDVVIKQCLGLDTFNGIGLFGKSYDGDRARKAVIEDTLMAARNNVIRYGQSDIHATNLVGNASWTLNREPGRAFAWDWIRKVHQGHPNRTHPPRWTNCRYIGYEKMLDVEGGLDVNHGQEVPRDPLLAGYQPPMAGWWDTWLDQADNLVARELVNAAVTGDETDGEHGDGAPIPTEPTEPALNLIVFGVALAAMRAELDELQAAVGQFALDMEAAAKGLQSGIFEDEEDEPETPNRPIRRNLHGDILPDD